MPYLPCYYLLHINYFLHLLSTNHKCAHLAIFPLLLKPAAQEKMDWNSLMRRSRLRVAPVVVPMELCSLSLLCFPKSHNSF
jgi:hypothetical protein